MHGEEDSNGAYLPYIPPWRLGIGLHGGWKEFGAGIDAIIADDQDKVATNELPTEGYTLVNANLSYTFAESGLYMFLRGTNLLDEEARRARSFLKDFAPQPGASVRAGVRVEF